MKRRIAMGGLRDFLDTREARMRDHAQPFNWATIVNRRRVDGDAPNYGRQWEVQVQHSGDPAPSGAWHQVAPGILPVIGDLADLQWRDAHQATLVRLVDTTRNVSQHPYKVAVYWSGSLTVGPGWTPIEYTDVNFDPSGMYTGSGVLIPVDGHYQVTMRAGVDSGGTTSDTTCAIYQSGFETRRGTELTATGPVGSVLSDKLDLYEGWLIKSYVFSSAGGALRSGYNENWLSISLSDQ